MAKTAGSTSVPKNMQATYDAITALTDAFCREYLVETHSRRPPAAPGASRRRYLRAASPFIDPHRRARPTYLTFSSSQFAITSTMAALFCSSIIMCPLPCTPAFSSRRWVFGTPAWVRNFEVQWS